MINSDQPFWHSNSHLWLLTVNILPVCELTVYRRQAGYLLYLFSPVTDLELPIVSACDGWIAVALSVLAHFLFKKQTQVCAHTSGKFLSGWFPASGRPFSSASPEFPSDWWHLHCSPRCRYLPIRQELMMSLIRWCVARIEFTSCSD